MSVNWDSLQMRDVEVTIHMWRPLRSIKADWGRVAVGSAPGLELLVGTLLSGQQLILLHQFLHVRIHFSAG